MQRYEHKAPITAAKIHSILHDKDYGRDTSWRLIFECDTPPVVVSKGWMELNKPKLGGYYVVDRVPGVSEFIPAHLFEVEYKHVTTKTVLVDGETFAMGDTLYKSVDDYTPDQMREYIDGAIKEGFTLPDVGVDLYDIVSLKEAYGRAWDWYNRGGAIRDGVDVGLVNCAHTPSFSPVSFEDAARPLIKWLAENAHPHTAVHVTSTAAELFEASYVFPTDEYLVD